MQIIATRAILDMPLCMSNAASSVEVSPLKELSEKERIYGKDTMTTMIIQLDGENSAA